MRSRGVPKLLCQRPGRHFSSYKWDMMLDPSMPSQVSYQFETDRPELAQVFQSMTMNPFKIYNLCHNFTTEIITYMSDHLGLGWISGVVLGTVLIR